MLMWFERQESAVHGAHICEIGDDTNSSDFVMPHRSDSKYNERNLYPLL